MKESIDPAEKQSAAGSGALLANLSALDKLEKQ